VVCRTARHLLDDVKAGEREPLIPGHEIAGRITKIGDDVYTAKVGDTVGVHFEQPCGRCRQCRRQRTNLCEEGTTLGFDAPGGYAEFVVAKQTTVLPLPPNVDVTVAAPLADSGATAYRSVVALGQAEEGDLVVVIGSGGVGLSAVQVAKAYGARVLAIDLKEEARKAALDCGADRAVNPKEAPSATQEFADRAGADVAIDLVGTKATLELARSLLGPGRRRRAQAPVIEGPRTSRPVSRSHGTLSTHLLRADAGRSATRLPSGHEFDPPARRLEDGDFTPVSRISSSTPPASQALSCRRQSTGRGPSREPPGIETPSSAPLREMRAAPSTVTHRPRAVTM